MIDDIENAITLSMQEGSMRAELETQEQHLKRARELIENRGKKCNREQCKKLSRSEREQAMKQAMMNWNE